MNKHQPVIDHLRKLASGEAKPKKPNCGLCCEIYDFTQPLNYSYSEFSLRIMDSYKSWPKWSGDSNYPIASQISKNKCAAGPAYYAADADEMWFAGKYAEDRKELCLHIADYLENLK